MEAMKYNKQRKSAPEPSVAIYNDRICSILAKQNLTNCEVDQMRGS